MMKTLKIKVATITGHFKVEKHNASNILNTVLLWANQTKTQAVYFEYAENKEPYTFFVGEVKDGTFTEYTKYMYYLPFYDTDKTINTNGFTVGRFDFINDTLTIEKQRKNGVLIKRHNLAKLTLSSRLRLYALFAQQWTHKVKIHTSRNVIYYNNVHVKNLYNAIITELSHTYLHNQNLYTYNVINHRTQLLETFVSLIEQGNPIPEELYRRIVIFAITSSPVELDYRVRELGATVLASLPERIALSAIQIIRERIQQSFKELDAIEAVFLNKIPLPPSPLNQNKISSSEKVIRPNFRPEQNNDDNGEKQ